MPSYLRVWRQNGGCDYTIGCGIRVETITAKSIADARKETIEAIIDSDEEFVESLESVEVWGLTGIHEKLDEDQWAREAHAKREADQKAKIEEDERAQLKRLQEKYK